MVSHRATEESPHESLNIYHYPNAPSFGIFIFHMNVLRTIIWFIQYLFVRLAVLLYGLIPASKAYALGFGLGASAYPLFRKRRRIAVDNILQAKITDDPKEADRIARHSFGHFAGHICESMKVPLVVTAENWREHIVLEGDKADGWDLLMEQTDTPMMLLTGHHGAWEAAVTVIPFTRPMVTIARTPNNPIVERFLKTKHFRGNITVIPKSQGFTPGVIRDWLERKAALTIVMDQHAGAKHGVKVDFLGRPAYTHTSPARIHLATGAPIVVGSFLRDGLFKYRMVAEAPIRFTPTGDKDKDIEALLTEMNLRLGNLVRRCPEQYLWSHKRWRT